MTTITIEQAGLFQAAHINLGNLKEDKTHDNTEETEKKKLIDYTDFFAKNPHYREYQRERFNWLRQFTANLTHTQNAPLIGRGEKFISHDGNSILTVKGNKISATNKNGEPDIKAMLDLAEAHGWQSIRLPKMLGKGSRAYRQELWLEAKRRGIEVENYKPTQAEEQKLAGLLAKEQDNQALKIVPTKEVSGSLKKDKGDDHNEALKDHSLSQQEAHTQLMNVLNEFFPFDSPSYNDAETKIAEHLADIYSQNKVVTTKDIKNTRAMYQAKMPQMREQYFQATQHEQYKEKTAQHTKQQSHNKNKELAR
ncbi:MAG: hypothetical protein IJ187_00995 [Neisseriaceae bacterium]|nr:hypothetical protein [Neisseriaceae bacterium]MBQ9725237.1 hypothetical protein [Neisseriaceae bacterium]